MKITNSVNETYKFTAREITEIFIWAYGYADIARQGFLPVDLDRNVENAEIFRKLKQLLRNDIEVIQYEGKFPEEVFDTLILMAQLLQKYKTK